MKTLLTFLSILLTSTLAHAEMVVVVAENSSIESISGQQVSNIFLAKSNRFSNGGKAIPLEVKNNQLRTDFYQRISNKTPTQLKSYWTTLIFTGKGRPPKSISNKVDLLKHMKDQPGAITYIRSSEVTAEMKVVYRFNKNISN